MERRRRRTLGEQLRVILPIFVVWTIGFLLLLFVGTRDQTTSSAMLLDPTFTPGLNWYSGLISNLGVLAWTVAAVAAAAGSWLCVMGGRRNAARFLRHGAYLGAVLLFDDLFQFHAILVPSWLGVDKIVPVFLIGVAGVAWAVSHRREIKRTHVHLIGAALVGMALSVFIDTTVGPAPGEAGLMFEDGAKFLGALAWATYFVITTRDICRSVFTDALMVWPDQAIAALAGSEPPRGRHRRVDADEAPAAVATSAAGTDAVDELGLAEMTAGGEDQADDDSFAGTSLA